MNKFEQVHVVEGSIDLLASGRLAFNSKAFLLHLHLDASDKFSVTENNNLKTHQTEPWYKSEKCPFIESTRTLQCRPAVMCGSHRA